MEASALREAADRVERMERCFDLLCEAAAAKHAALKEDVLCRELLRILTAYYEGGQWLRDYELDEQGLLPPELKRGVLSQDAVWDLLAEVGAAG